MCLTDIHFHIHRFSLNIVCNAFLSFSYFFFANLLSWYDRIGIMCIDVDCRNGIVVQSRTECERNVDMEKRNKKK